MRYLWSCLLTVAIVACGDSAIGPDRITEHYSLRSVNGLDLPYKLAEVGETRLEVFGGGMTLDSNGDVHHILTLRLSTPEDEYFRRNYGAHYTEDFTQMTSGRWVLEGKNLHLSFTGSAGEPICLSVLCISTEGKSVHPSELLGVLDEQGVTLSETVRGVEGRNIDGNVAIARADYSLTLVFQR
jgi:hypothetical protein